MSDDPAECPAVHLRQPVLLRRLRDAHAAKPDSPWLSVGIVPNLYWQAFQELKAQGLVVHHGTLIALTDHGREVAARLV